MIVHTTRDETGPNEPAPNRAEKVSSRIGIDWRLFMFRAIPLMMPSVPRVTRKEGIRILTVMRPLNRPTTTPVATAATAPARNP